MSWAKDESEQCIALTLDGRRCRQVGSRLHRRPVCAHHLIHGVIAYDDIEALLARRRKEEESRCVAMRVGAPGRCRRTGVRTSMGRLVCVAHALHGFVAFDETSVDPRIAERARAVMED